MARNTPGSGTRRGGSVAAPPPMRGRNETTDRLYQTLSRLPMWDLINVLDALATNMGNGDVGLGYERARALSRSYGALGRRS